MGGGEGDLFNQPTNQPVHVNKKLRFSAQLRWSSYWFYLWFLFTALLRLISLDLFYTYIIAQHIACPPTIRVGIDFKIARNGE